MIYDVITTKRFDKEVKLCVKRGYDMKNLRTIIKLLAETGVLPKEYKPHKLKGDFKGTIECHVEPDWLLIYEKTDKIRLIRLLRTGTHADLYGK
jgi:mRNA interferase YafQ